MGNTQNNSIINNILVEYGKCIKKGFTLAEFLITLGIIGIVAAMTLPSLIHNQKKKEIETKLARIYSVMNQAIMLSEAEHGDKKYWDYYDVYDASSSNLTYEDSLKWYNKYLAKYIKTTKVEKSLDTSEVLFLYFADGSILAIAPWCTGMAFYLNKKAVQNKKPGCFNV